MIEQLIMNKTSKVEVGAKVITEEGGKLELKEIAELDPAIGMVKLCDGSRCYPAKTKQVYMTVLHTSSGRREVVGMLESESAIRGSFPAIR